MDSSSYGGCVVHLGVGDEGFVVDVGCAVHLEVGSEGFVKELFCPGDMSALGIGLFAAGKATG